MATVCGQCGTSNEDGAYLCVECQAPLSGVSPTEAVTPRPNAWRLVPKQSGRVRDDLGIYLNSIILDIGRFDNDTGPVEVDVSDWPGGAATSRRHARLEFVGVGWKLSDLGSTNGVFVRSPGRDRFSARIVEPVIVKGGDEIGLGTVMCVLEGPDVDAAAAVEADTGQVVAPESGATPSPERAAPAGAAGAEPPPEEEEEDVSTEWTETV